MYRGQTCPLAGVIEASQLVIPPREVPGAHCHVCAGALEHPRERFGLALELMLRPWAPRAQGPTGRKQWGTKALGKRPKRRAFGHGSCRGHATRS
jgi:hypothetical protein